MTRTFALALALVLVLSIAAGCDGGGAQEAGPVPGGGQGSNPAASTGSKNTGSTSGASTSTSVPEAALCSDRTATVEVVSQRGAAGTIGTTWRVTNDSQAPCRTFGYPGMDFHTSSGWLDVQVQRGGLAVIDEDPAQIVLDPGESLYFMSFWSDVDTESGPCKEFDRVKVTLPDNFVPARLAASGCLNPESVRVGPVSTTQPS